MSVVLIGIGIFWTIIFTKKLLFWTWLWQLKEYHWKRLQAHFNTYKGKKLALSPFRILEIISLPGLILNPNIFVFVLFFVFWVEAMRTGLSLFRKRFFYPVFTKKIIAILTLGLLLESGLLVVFYLTQSLVLLLSASIFAPILISGLILSFQPFVLAWQKKMLQKAKIKREKFENLKVIGITGSYGKSSVKEFLARILSEKYKVLKTKKNQNSEVGIARLVLGELNKTYDVLICEIGAYEKGKIKQVANVIQPQTGILTGINEQHLATFGSQENIVEGKFELVKSLPKGGLAIFNKDNEHIRFKIQDLQFKDKNKKTCSINKEADLWAENIFVEKESVSFQMVSKTGERAEVKLPVLGKHNVINFLLSAGAAQELGMTLKEIAQVGKTIKTPQSGMKISRGRGGVTIIDDTYSANPHGVKAALDYLALYNGKKIIIMPCLIELGKEGGRIHKEIGEKISRICDLAIITTKDYFKEIKQNNKKVLFLTEFDTIFEKLKPFLKKGNAILLEGRTPAILNRLLNGAK